MIDTPVHRIASIASPCLRYKIYTYIRIMPETVAHLSQSIPA